jgi:GalNAc-alpha-(1->4)-GalNAc-alpha-(1->3)-diNAcBac-PP-undecaprenol alpha-1,4-N-acetyl-D-galactosaminyltransferase
MKIVFVIPTLRQGGMERFVSVLANYFESKQIYVTIVFLVPKEERFYSLNKNVETISPSFSHTASLISKFYYKIKLLWYIRKEIKSIKPMCVISLPQIYNNLTILALLKSKIPIYVSDRKNPLTDIGYLNNLLRKLLYPYATGIIAQTSFAKKTMIKNGLTNGNIKVIPNPIKKLTTYNKTKFKNHIVLNVGRLTSEKNQKELIEIFTQINKPNWKLIIVGSGGLEQDLQNQINSLNAINNIKLVGASDNVDKWLAEADIFAFTSLTEGFPNALLEAMAYPIASISYDCNTGPRELIKDGVNGFLIPMSDRDLYINKLKEMMDNQHLRESLKAEAYKIRRKYAINKIGQEVLQFVTQKY